MGALIPPALAGGQRFAEDDQEELEPVEITDERLRPQSLSSLARLLASEHSIATDYHSLLGDQQTDALGYYLADRNFKYTRIPDEGTMSQMISKDVSANIDDLMPDLLRVVSASDQLIEYESGGPGDRQYVQEVTATVNAVLRRQVDFKEQVHDFIKDGLIQKLGLFEVQVLSEHQIPQRLVNPDYATLMWHAQQPSTISIRRIEGNDAIVNKLIPTKFRIQAVAPEDLSVSLDGDTLDQSTVDGPRYVGLRRHLSVGSIIQQWPKQAAKILAAASIHTDQTVDDGGTQAADLEQLRRWRGEHDDNIAMSENLLASPTWIYREFYRVDLDRDGYPELLQIIRVGNYILHYEPVADNPFAWWMPYRIPHAFWGEAQADKITSIQDYRTSFLRSSTDAAAYAARPRLAYDYQLADRFGTPTMADILRSEPGSPIRTPGDPRATLSTVSVGDVTTPAIRALEYGDQLKEEWSGQSRRQRGLDPETVANESGTKYDKLIQVGSARTEFIAWRLSGGFEILGRKLVTALRTHSQPVDVKLQGGWQQVNPAWWPDTLVPIVHVSGAVGSRDIEVEHLLLLFQKQNEMISAAGLENPWVGFPELAETLHALINTLGFRDVERFLKSPPQEISQQFIENILANQQEDPRVLVERMKQEGENTRAQGSAQVDKYRLDQTASTERGKKKADVRMKGAELKQDRELRMRELDIEEKKLELERDKIRAEREAAEREERANGPGNES